MADLAPSLDTSLLVPRIWSEAQAASYTNQLALAYSRGQGPDPSIPVIGTIACGLVVTYAFNRTAVFETVNHGHLQALGMSLQSVHETALANLTEFIRHRLRATRIAVTPRSSGGSDSGHSLIFQLEVGEDMEASCILLSWLWSSLAEKVAGPLWVAIPTRRHFLFCGADEEPFILRNAASEIFAESRGKGISQQVFALQGSSMVSV